MTVVVPRAFNYKFFADPFNTFHGEQWSHKGRNDQRDADNVDDMKAGVLFRNVENAQTGSKSGKIRS